MAKYLKPDSELGYIEDRAGIEYAKFNNLRHVATGFMIGDFDNNGVYVVSPEIVSELIAMKKFIVDVDDNIEICHAELRLDKPFTFVITYEGNRATLSLLEKVNYESNYRVNGGAYSNINEFILDEVETSGTINKNTLYNRWNINEFGGEEVDIFNCDDAILQKYFGIVNRFKYLLDANIALIEKHQELEEIESEYAVRVLDMLEAYPQLKKVVKQEINNSVKAKKDFVCLDKPNFAKTINEIIDKAIEENAELVPEERKEEFNIDKGNILRDINIKREDVLKTIVVTTQQKDAEFVEDNKIGKDNNETRVVKIETQRVDEVTKEEIDNTAKTYTNQEKKLTEKVYARTAKVLDDSQKDQSSTRLGALAKAIVGITGDEKHILSPDAEKEFIKPAVVEDVITTPTASVTPNAKTPETKTEKKPETKTEKKPETKAEKKTEKKVEKKAENQGAKKVEKSGNTTDNKAQEDSKDTKNLVAQATDAKRTIYVPSAGGIAGGASSAQGGNNNSNQQNENPVPDAQNGGEQQDEIQNLMHFKGGVTAGADAQEEVNTETNKNEEVNAVANNAEDIDAKKAVVTNQEISIGESQNSLVGVALQNNAQEKEHEAIIQSTGNATFESVDIKVDVDDLFEV